MAHKKKPRPKMRENIDGACTTCGHVCMRVNQVSCTVHGIPRNKKECKELREMTKQCQCGVRLFFEEIMMPHPFRKNGVTFPGGHYFCEMCGSISRSRSSDSKYAEWVEDMVLHHGNHLPKADHRQGEV